MLSTLPARSLRGARKVSYPDTVKYLYSLGNELKPGAKFGLEPMRKLLSGLGNPESGQRFIHVAGTNGKGSTCATISSILREAGFRAGLYTSPHLIEPTERIEIDGRAITRAQFATAFETVHAAAEQLLATEELAIHPSYFETVTAMALLLFRESCNIAVLEVGLGGRLDATNIVTPDLCVITPVAYDHEAFLGNTLESIASEKAGILKPRVPVLLSPQLAAAEAVIAARACDLGCEVIRTADHPISDIRSSPGGSEFRLSGRTYRCVLPGRHQIDNARTAILASRRLNVPEHSIQAGLDTVVWPGRLEFVAHNPDFVLDGAHNPAAAAALASYIREFCGDRPVWLVYGAMRDKAIDEVTEQLFPLATHLILTAPNFSRALRPEAILEIDGHPNVHITPTIAEAIEMAHTAPPNAIVFFTGSLFLVGEARALLVKRSESVS
jgi:dihydrofolate synthase/folylpolyglutamate synthase